jgi:hypothetical protein
MAKTKTLHRKHWFIVIIGGLAASQLALGNSMNPNHEKVHQQIIRSSNTTYEINVGGNLDEFNTRRYTGHYECAFQPNIEVTITNTGNTEVVNPRIIVNGSRNWFSLQEILSEIVRPSMTEEEKTFAVWNWCRQNISTGPGGGGILYGENASVVVFMNSIGVGACGTFHAAMPLLAKAAGVEAETGVLANGSHAVQREKWGGKYHYLDCMIPATTGEQPKGHFALCYDNKTVASSEECAEDHYLMERAAPSDYLNAVLHGPGSSFWPINKSWTDTHTMGYTLRPGESITREWKPINFGWQGSNLKSNARGWFKYEVRLTEEQVQKYGKAENLVFYPEGVSVKEPSKPAFLIYRMASPYILIGGKVSIRCKVPFPDRGLASVQYRFDELGDNWETAWESRESGVILADITLPDCKEFHEPFTTYSFEVKINLSPGCLLSKLSIQADFQTYIPSLPSLRAGRNTIQYVDDTKLPHQVTITHRWIEKTAKIPAAPIPQWPTNGVKAPFTTSFRWSPPSNVEVDAYEFYLSPRPDMAWPLLGTFHYVSYSNKPEYTPFTPDAFNDGQTYYWRVRARSKEGVWGPWSQTASFVARGPHPPTNFRVDYTSDGRIVLRWEVPKSGAPAIKYEIYGSQEPAFGPLRKPIVQQAWANKTPIRRLPNLIATTSDLAFDITHRQEPFYRVVAIDASGARSVPTAIIEVSHPRLVPSAPIRAYVGKSMLFRLPIRKSFGKAVWTLREGLIRQNPDRFTVEILTKPEWLVFEEKTCTVKGIPPREGNYEFTVRLTTLDSLSEEKYKIVVKEPPR